MRKSEFRIGCVGSDWDANETVLNEAAQRAGRANACCVRPVPLNGTENGNNIVDAVLVMAKVGSKTMHVCTPVRIVDLDGKPWAAAVDAVETAMKELINEAAVLRLR